MIITSDIEANNLYNYRDKTKPTIMHCAAVVENKSKKEHKFVGDYDEYVRILKDCEFVVGHNFIQYDRQVIKEQTGYEIPLMKIRDTLVLSKLLGPKSRPSHSLGSYGEEMNQPKPEHEEWDKFSPEMWTRCIEDTRLNLNVYNDLWTKFETLGFSMNSLKVETVMAELMRQQEENGCPLDVEFCRKVFYEIKDKADALEEKISKVFARVPDNRKSQLYEYNPKFKKDGTLHANCEKKLNEYGLPKDTGYSTFFKWRDFDINATEFVKAHLLRLGWQPTEFTEKGSPKLSEDSLKMFDLEEGILLKDYILLRNRQKVFNRWLEEVSDEGYVHAFQNPLGTWTHRHSHSHYMGNPPRLEEKKIKTQVDFDKYSDSFVDDLDVLQKKLNGEGEFEAVVKGLEGGYGYECRKAWVKPHGSSDDVLVGADASGIQMRAFAHYINDAAYTQQILTSDIHVYNQELAGLKSRANSKTFIYMYLLGGGNHKAGVIYGPSDEEMKEFKDEVMSSHNDWLRDNVLKFGLEFLNIPKTPHNYALAYKGYHVKKKFEDSIPGLKQFKQEAKKKGPHWFEAIDGRKIKVWSAHKTLAAALQSFEACVMKRACIIMCRTLHDKGIDFRLRNMVHDEFLVSTEKSKADVVGETMVGSIIKAGQIYNSKCPLDGDYRVGSSWLEVH